MGLNTPSGGGGAPTDAEYVTGSSNSELNNETVVSPASEILTQGSFGASVSISPSFGSYLVASANHPTLIILQLATATDGNNPAIIKVNVDLSGGSTADYIAGEIGTPNEGLALDATDRGSVTFPLPPGGAFQVENTLDPKNANTIQTARALVIA